MYFFHLFIKNNEKYKIIDCHYYNTYYYNIYIDCQNIIKSIKKVLNNSSVIWFIVF